ncbi:MAG: M56 family metallopeptidase [Vicinamibacterales bacterium]
MTVTIIVKVTIALALSLLAVRLARQRRAATRHFVLTTVFGIAALLPITAAVVPSVRVDVPPVPVVVQDYLPDSIAIAGPRGDDGRFLTVDGSEGIRVEPVTLPQLLLAVWAVGAVLFAMPIFAGLFQVSRLRQTGLPWTVGQNLVDGLARDAGLRRRITVLCHDRIPAPATSGLRQHIIFFPLDAARWSEDDILRAAVHEVEHVRRWDGGISAMARIVVAVYWFHPMAWVAWSRLMLEAERACDDAVLRRSESTAYVDQLITLAGRLSNKPRHPLLAMANRGDLAHRVSALLDGRQARGRLGRIAAAVISLAAIAVVVIIAPLQAHSRSRDLYVNTPAMSALQSATQVSADGAQQLSGTWQGTLRVRRGDLRIVIRITKGDSEDLRVVMSSIDEGPGTFAASSVTLQDTNLRMVFPALAATFEAKLNAEGTSIAGTWSQGQSWPLTLTKATAETAWTIPDPSPARAAMAADADPSFEVATIRRSSPGDGRPPLIQLQNRRWIAINRTVMDFITYAYDLHWGLVVNAPGWLSEQYDVTAQPGGEGQPNRRQWQTMVRKLLVDRFKLSAHVEKRNISVYALTVKDAPRSLAPSTGDPAGPANLATRARGRFQARNASMEDLAGVLGGLLDRPVVDRTGIPGRYDFNLRWTLDEFQSAVLKAFPVPQGYGEDPDLLTAIQDQLGLKLERANAPAEVLIIDHIERPSEN